MCFHICAGYGCWHYPPVSFTATVENDTIKLPVGVHLPDGTEVTIEPKQAAMNASETDSEPVRHRDLDLLAGTWIDDPEFDQALAEQRKVDVEMWK